MYHKRRTGFDTEAIAQIWGFNLLLVLALFATYVGVPFLKSSVLEYQNIKADPFDGTVSPIAYVPNWLDAKYANRSLRFEDVDLDSFVEIPRYDADLLRIEDPKNRLAVLERSTYITPYMGSYRMNFEEYDGSHLGVDIRAPLGTPVLSIANGVVVRTNNRDSWDGKYVIVRHDSVPTSSGIDTVYSAYLHLESVSVEPGTKIRKGQPIGKVGMTGITTTPHLHFQIDKESTPYHPYWPYSFRDAQEIGIDFFSAVNLGLGKENALKYTIHPTEFVQRNLTYVAAAAIASPKTVTLASDSTPSASVPSESAPRNSAPQETPAVSKESPDVLVSVPETKPVVETKPAVVASSAPKASDPMTRREAVMVIALALGTTPLEFGDLPFSDVLPSDSVAGILSRFVELGYVGSTDKFRPNDAITRAEAAIIITRASGIAPVPGYPAFRDIKASDSRAATLNAFARALKLRKGITYWMETPLSRGQFEKMFATWKQKTGKLR